MSAVIQIKDLHFSYHNAENDSERSVIEGIDLSVEQGEFLAILGHNGSGKSTLAKHLNAILTPSSGTVTVHGMDTSDPKNLYPLRESVGMVFQNPDNQLVATIVEEDVAFAPENLGLPPSEIRLRVDYALKTVGMYDFIHHAPHMLSGGQKQRIAIAGVLAMKPKVLVLDEPTAMLDPSGRNDIMKTLKTLNKEENMTIVLITHFMNEACEADRVVVLNDGKIIKQGVPKEVFNDVELLNSVGLDVPQSTELLYKLSQSGKDVSTNILTVDECIDEILAKRRV